MRIGQECPGGRGGVSCQTEIPETRLVGLSHIIGKSQTRQRLFRDIKIAVYLYLRQHITPSTHHRTWTLRVSATVFPSSLSHSILALKLFHTPMLNWSKPVYWAMASPLVVLRVHATLTISLVDVSAPAAQAIETMRARPDLLSESISFRVYTTLTTFRLELSLFALHCVNYWGSRRSPVPSNRPTNLSTHTFASDAAVVPQITPDDYERTSFYNGIAGDDGHPELVYRSDYLTTPFPRPVGR